MLAEKFENSLLISEKIQKIRNLFVLIEKAVTRNDKDGKEIAKTIP